VTLIDSHCHLDFSCFDTDRAAVLQRAQAAKVNAIIIPATQAKDWQRLQQCCQQSTYPLYAAYGLHPFFIQTHQPADLTQLEIYLSHPDTIAVGECGLDFWHKPDRQSQQQQLSYLTAQLSLATQFDLPVIIHARRSLDLIIQQIRHYSGLRGVIHSFSGSLQQAQICLDLGFKLGIGGPITYPRATRLQKLVSILPLSTWLLETDAPDQPIYNHQGQRNEPDKIMAIFDAFVTCRTENPADIAAQLSQNTQQLLIPNHVSHVN